MCMSKGMIKGHVTTSYEQRVKRGNVRKESNCSRSRMCYFCTATLYSGVHDLL